MSASRSEKLITRGLEEPRDSRCHPNIKRDKWHFDKVRRIKNTLMKPRKIETKRGKERVVESPNNWRRGG